MPRLPRNLKMDAEGRYHLRGQVAGPAGHYPLQRPEDARQLVRIIRHYTGLFFCQVACLSILGNHYHLVVVFEAFRELSRQELLALARLFYPRPGYQPYRRWTARDWKRFNRRLFNVSELMRNIQSDFARWYNRRYHRKGPFWAGRFQSTESEDLLQTVFYVELNAVRAHLTQRPEQWPYSSAWLRKQGRDDWLMPLEQLLGMPDRREAERLFWTQLYWCGTEGNKEHDGRIPPEFAARMEQEMYGRGCFLKSIPAFSRGRVVGSLETIRQVLDRCRQQGLYKRRKNPVPLGVGNLYALREQRSNYVQI